jgi:AcrR family transcriptional regulator
MSITADAVKIFATGFELFKRFGIKAVTMEQISSACGISKKTLYKFVSNKADFLFQSFSFFAQSMEGVLYEVLENNGGNAIDDLFAIERFAEKHMRGDEDRLIGQLEQYYPELAPRLKKKREEVVFKITQDNLKKGIEEGLYRQDIAVDHITILYYGHILATHENNIAERPADLDELRQTSLRYHIRGIASDKGIQYLNQIINNEE